MNLGSIEYSVEYIRLYNLLYRCKSCREWRKKEKPGTKRQFIVRKNRIILKKAKIGDTLPCVYSCKRITADDIEYYDLMRFEELRDEFEPLVIDFNEENARMNAYAETDESGAWIKIEISTIS